MVDFNLQRFDNGPAGTCNQATYAALGRWLAVGGLFVFLVFGYAWIHSEILGINYEIQRLSQENEELREGNASLQSEIASLTAPEKVERAARKLGLITPNDPRVRLVETRDKTRIRSLLARSEPRQQTLNE